MKEIVSIQYLRVAAVALLVLGAGGESDFPVTEIAATLFFVITAFVSWVMAAAHPIAPGRFLQNRIIRIAPLYWVFLMGAATFPNLFGVSTPDLLRAFLFMPQWTQGVGLEGPAFDIIGAMNLIIAFAVLFTLSLRLKPRRRLSFLLGVILSAATFGVFNEQPQNAALALYTSPAVIGFGFGILLGDAWVCGGYRFAQKPGLWKIGAALILAASAVVFWAGDPAMTGFSTIFAAPIICAGALLCESALSRRPNQSLLAIGATSYAVCLFHGVALAIFSPIAAPMIVSLPTEIAILAVPIADIAICLGLGVVVFHIMERPLARGARHAVRTERHVIFASLRRATLTRRHSAAEIVASSQ